MDHKRKPPSQPPSPSSPDENDALKMIVAGFEKFLGVPLLPPCPSCTELKNKTLDAFNKAMADGSATVTAKFQPTGAKHGGNQQGIQILFGTGDPALMILMAGLVALHTQRVAAEYWIKKEGCAPVEVQHRFKALQELGQYLETEYNRRLKTIEALENPGKD